MRWPPWISKSNSEPTLNENRETAKNGSETQSSPSPSLSIPASPKQTQQSQSQSLFLESTGLSSFFSNSNPSNSNFTNPETLLTSFILTSSVLSAFYIHRRFLRRFPNATSVCPSYFRSRSRSIFGYVTSVGDGDNFRMYHTPGGRMMGWGWLPWRKVPALKKELKDKTIHVRLAGVDAPELAHFGRPEQPFAREAHEWLTSYLLNRRVRVYVYRQDQYQRVVGSVFMRRALDFPIPFRKRDVSYEMLKRGLATVYEAKSGAEFGGANVEKKYRNAEWWARTRGKGMWKGYRWSRDEWESPREYKNRYSQTVVEGKK